MQRSSLGVGLVLLSLALVSWGTQEYIARQSRAEVEKTLKTVLTTTRNELQDWAMRTERHSAILAGTPKVETAVASLVGLPDNRAALLASPAQEFLQSQLLPVLSAMGYKGYTVVNRHGRNIASDHADLVGSYSVLLRQEGLLDRVWKGEPVVSRPMPANIPLTDADGVPRWGLPTLFAVAPVLDKEGKVVAALALRVDPFDRFVPIVQQGRVGYSGETYLVDKQATMASPSRFERNLRRLGILDDGERSMLNLAVRNPGVDLSLGRHSPVAPGDRPPTKAAAQVIEGKDGSDLEGYRDYRGVEVLGAWAMVPALGLGVVTEIDESEALATLHSTRVAMSLATAATMLAIAILVWMFTLARRRLVARERQLQAILDNSSALISVKDAEGRYLTVNREFIRRLGLPPEDILGRSDFDLFPPAEADPCRVHDRQVMEEQQPLEVTEELTLAGKNCHFLAVKFPLPDASGKNPGLGSIATDVTARIDGEEALRRLNEELEARVAERTREAEEANRAKGEFLANLSHEIRTPLSVITGLTRLALGGGSGPRTRDYLRRVHAAGLSLLELVNDILDFSKIEAGKMEVETAPFDLRGDVLDNVAAMAGMKAGEKGLELLVDCPPDLPHRLVGDPLRLVQVLLNLTANAVRFTDEGEVAISVSAVERQGERVVLRFEVRDTGIGIGHLQLTRLFQPFTQVEVSPGRSRGGTGLGLTICRRLANLMGGDISAQSEPGQGSTFRVDLPFTIDHQASPVRILPGKLHGTQVLVAENHDQARRLIARSLESFGLTAVETANGQEALSLLADPAPETGFRLAFLGSLAGLDGLEVAKRIRAEPPPTEPAIVLLAPWGREDLMEQADALGLQGIIVKPVVDATLFDTVLAALAPEAGTPSSSPTVGAGAASLAGRRFLAAEDDEDNRIVLSEILSGLGAEAIVATDGETLLELLEQGPVDAVLMDVRLPGRDGIETTRRLRSDPRFANLPIIGITAFATADMRRQCLDAGMTDFLAKPLDERKLAAVLGRLPKAKEV